MTKANLGLGYSPLSNRIQIAKFKKIGDSTVMRVGNVEPIDVTEQALQCSYHLVIDEGGVVQWSLDNGDVMKLSAELIKG